MARVEIREAYFLYIWILEQIIGAGRTLKARTEN